VNPTVYHDLAARYSRAELLRLRDQAPAAMRHIYGMALSLKAMAERRTDHAVLCMDCGSECGRSPVSGSTGLCDPCLEARS